MKPGDKQLLFVGGTRGWFQEVEQQLLTWRPGWVGRHVIDASQARTLLTCVPWEAMILYDNLSGSPELRSEAQRIHPHLLIVSLLDEVNHGNSPAGPDSVGTPKVTLEPGEAVETVVRTLSLHEWTSQAAMSALLKRINKLPTLPRLHSQVTQELRSPNGSLEVVSQFIRKDPVMAAKFLQVINSSFFGMAYTITDPGEAVMYLGAERTRNLVLMAGVFCQFNELRCPDFSAEQIWQHSLQVASLAQGITLFQTEDPKLAEMAFTAGLLHDIGKLVLAGNLPEMYATAHKLQQFKRIQQSEAELTILGTAHPELGACLLGTWRLPMRLVEAVAWHHRPSSSHDTSFSALTAVHVANVLAHEISEANVGIGLPSRFDMLYLVRLRLLGRRNDWREACGMPIKEEERPKVAEPRF